MIKQIAWKVLQAAVMIYVAVYVYQNLWEDTPPHLSGMVAIISGVLAAAALTAVIYEACSRRPWPIRAIQLILLLTCVFLGWTQNPIGAVVFGLLTTLSITVTIDMAVALVGRVRAKFSRSPMKEPAVHMSKAGQRALTPR
jgi:hypothetical protein